MAVAVSLLIVGERRGSRALIWVTKPLASALFVAIALVEGIPSTLASGFLVVAILLAFVGDVLLVLREARIFRLAILVFLLAHVGFVAAFLALGLAWGWVALALLPLTASAWVIARWVLPHVDGALRAPVLAYVLVITLMVAAAVGATAAGATPLLLAAALLFYANDLLVARDRFVARSWMNRLAGLPLYYGAMVIYALQVD